VCDLETSRMGAPYIYDISHLRVNKTIIQHFETRARYLTGETEICTSPHVGRIIRLTNHNLHAEKPGIDPRTEWQEECLHFHTRYWRYDFCLAYFTDGSIQAYLDIQNKTTSSVFHFGRHAELLA